MKIKKVILFMILFMIGLICVEIKHIRGEEYVDHSGASLSPVYMDLGSITKKTKSFTVTVMNTGNPVSLKAKIDNAGSTKIEIKPSSFELSENERKDVSIKIYNNDELKVGVYDLSISFISDTIGQQSISAFGTNSLRLVFRKEGLAMATCNVKDIAPNQGVPFHSILCNFYNKSKTVDVITSIYYKASGELVWQQNDTISMEGYPVISYYGKIYTPLRSTSWEYGDYIYSLIASEKDNVLLNYQTEFNVGEMKGQLESVMTKDIPKGKIAEFKAVIRNIGNQNLPVSVQIYVKDKKQNLVYDEFQTDTILCGIDKGFLFQWPTKYTRVGKYSIEYTVIMGDQQETGTLFYTVKHSSCYMWIIISSIVIAIFFLILSLVIKFKINSNKVFKH